MVKDLVNFFGKPRGQSQPLSKGSPFKALQVRCDFPPETKLFHSVLIQFSTNTSFIIVSIIFSILNWSAVSQSWPVPLKKNTALDVRPFSVLSHLHKMTPGSSSAMSPFSSCSSLWWTLPTPDYLVPIWSIKIPVNLAWSRAANIKFLNICCIFKPNFFPSHFRLTSFLSYPSITDF